MKVALASDHRGFKFKQIIGKELRRRGLEVVDSGTYTPEPCDYPDYGKEAVRLLQAKEVDFAILICGSGIGMSIVANKFKGIRAAFCLNPEMARMAREHNDANVLVLSSNFTPQSELKKILESWLNSKFQGGRHERRVKKIAELEGS